MGERRYRIRVENADTQPTITAENQDEFDVVATIARAIKANEPRIVKIMVDDGYPGIAYNWDCPNWLLTSPYHGTEKSQADIGRAWISDHPERAMRIALLRMIVKSTTVQEVFRYYHIATDNAIWVASTMATELTYIEKPDWLLKETEEFITYQDVVRRIAYKLASDGWIA